MTALARDLEALAGADAVAAWRPGPGAAEVPLVSPPDAGSMAELLRWASRENKRVLPLGLGSKVGWCRPPAELDLALSTRAMRGVVAYAAGDGTVTARAGTTMAELARAVAEGGHRLTPDVPRPEGATLGGVLAAGQSGADRLRYGPSRHHVLGMGVLLGDGTPAKSGGRLVKNVTGFDLHRLYCGSHGTLCVIVEAALRLFPAPEREVWIGARAAATQEALRLADAALAPVLRPVSVSMERGGDGAWALGVHLAGKGPPVDAERETLLRAWRSAAGVEVLEDAAARRAGQAARDRSPCGGGGPWLHVSALPSALPAAIETLDGALVAARLAGRPIVRPGIAELEVAIEPLEGGLEPRSIAAVVRELRAALPRPARVALRDAPPSALEDLDPFGEPAPGLDLMRRIRRQLDPGGVLASGRFHGGL